ncbi:Tyrosinase central domain protein [Pleurostoma richardsiae]|uniref:Tyrosinase central domain protein n=1 Tax=Pleurostoma richardsiae TaxID=41990 RepID=A0AA38VBY0_9PEZI|nr:Tyrosinase central domain protein [Pleurostoma richardsiae]
MHAKFLTILAAASAVLATPVHVVPRDDANATDVLASLAQSAYDVAVDQVNSTTKRSSSCSLANIRIRREWGTLSKADRLSYINAVKCLQSKPAKTPAEVAPGAKTRFDDFVATHINQSLTIHYTGNFLSWHRYFTFLYEEALRNECGYKGTQPYWDWAKTAVTGMEKSPIFDGSDTSMSGNGEYIGPQDDIILGASTGLPPVYLPTGTGGGCVTSGPFKNMSVNLGPAALDLPGGIEIANPAGPLEYNPRCLKRDLTDAVNQAYANATAVLSNILKPKIIYDFQMQMQGVPGSGNIGIHGGGHYSLGGDPGRDVFTSPGDPAFYLHHGMIDRTWWIWQMLDPATRIYSDAAVSGTNTFLNSPASANTTLDDYVDYGYAAGPPRKIGDLLSTVSGPFCYVYL